MDVSIIIVNYNVKHFLEQALQSVLAASRNLKTEIWVVDNHSKDGSVEMIREKYPEVLLIANTDNPGFSKANNQAIRQAKGKHLLILNPDTLIEEDTLEKCFEYMENNKEVGALGVKMIDGQGKFLPESKRALPTPWVSFCKIFGLSSLFPKSEFFSKYHLGYLDEKQIHKIEILSGAFMWIRKEAIEKCGMFDEDFFMYGEDVDLSYRILKGNFQNIYFPETSIVHYKGESTKRGSLNYVRMFYQAMILFVNKHFAGREADLYSKAIHVAIYLRASLSMIKRVFIQIFPMLLDAILILAGLYYISTYWAQHIKNIQEYQSLVYYFNFPLYIGLWLLCNFLNGAYDKPFKILAHIKGIVVGTLFIASVYAFLDNSLRFSRAIILLGAVYAILQGVSWRMLYSFFKTGHWIQENSAFKRWIIIGEEDEVQRVKDIMKMYSQQYIGYINPKNGNDSEHLGSMDELQKIVKMFQIHEIIYCAKDISTKEIIQYMTSLKDSVQHKIIAKGSDYIVGSNSKHSPGELYSNELNMQICTPQNIRNKRLLDIIISIFLLLFSPLLWIIQTQKKNFFSNIFSVLSNKKTWVAYSENQNQSSLPKIKKGIIDCLPRKNQELLDKNKILQLDILYAKDYTPANDLIILLRKIRDLGCN